MRLGLKSSADPDQMESRLKYQPSVYEFYTSEHDLTKEGLSRLEQGIRRVKDAGIRDIILHHPVFYRGEMLDKDF
ncbi:xylose isomerase-like protein [Streptococcus mutans]|nr:xylose isomerase-like protein [Streptococcus mutans]